MNQDKTDQIVTCGGGPPGDPSGELSALPVADLVAMVARLRGEVEQLKLAEEGSEEAFGVVVQQKRDAEAQCKKLQGLLDACYKICGELARPSGI